MGGALRCSDGDHDDSSNQITHSHPPYTYDDTKNITNNIQTCTYSYDSGAAAALSNRVLLVCKGYDT